MEKFQKVLDHKNEWSNRNHLEWNILKFLSLRFRPIEDLKNSTLLLTIGVGSPLLVVVVVHYLALLQ